MNGGTRTSTIALGNPGAAWHLAAAGDFNADGTADLLFQNTDGSVLTWEVNGSSFVGHALVNPGSAWHIKGTADFNRDGHADIVWQHDNGDVAVWSMQNAAALITGPTTGVVASPGSAWQVGGVGDYNGDNYADIALQNSGTGEVAIWTMNGANLTPSGALLPQNPGTPWHLVV